MPTRILEQHLQREEGLPAHPRALFNAHPLATRTIEHPTRNLEAVLAGLLARYPAAQSATIWADNLCFDQKLSTE